MTPLEKSLIVFLSVALVCIVKKKERNENLIGAAIMGVKYKKCKKKLKKCRKKKRGTCNRVIVRRVIKQLRKLK